MSNSWDVQIADRLKGLSMGSVEALVVLFVRQIPEADMSSKVLKELTPLDLLTKSEDGFYGLKKGALTLQDYWDLVDLRNERNERKVRAELRKSRLS